MESVKFVFDELNIMSVVMLYHLFQNIGFYVEEITDITKFNKFKSSNYIANIIFFR